MTATETLQSLVHNLDEGVQIYTDGKSFKTGSCCWCGCLYRFFLWISGYEPADIKKINMVVKEQFKTQLQPQVQPQDRDCLLKLQRKYIIETRVEGETLDGYQVRLKSIGYQEGDLDPLLKELDQPGCSTAPTDRDPLIQSPEVRYLAVGSESEFNPWSYFTSIATEIEVLSPHLLTRQALEADMRRELEKRSDWTEEGVRRTYEVVLRPYYSDINKQQCRIILNKTQLPQALKEGLKKQADQMLDQHPRSFAETFSQLIDQQKTGYEAYGKTMREKLVNVYNALASGVGVKTRNAYAEFPVTWYSDMNLTHTFPEKVLGLIAKELKRGNLLDREPDLSMFVEPLRQAFGQGGSAQVRAALLTQVVEGIRKEVESLRGSAPERAF